MAIVRNFNLFLSAGHSIPLVINANQYDQGESWVFTLFNSDGTQYIPETGAIVGIKSDGLGIINSGSVVDGKVVITETQQMTAAPGKAVFELMIDNGTHGTANFLVLVEPKPGNNADLSDSDLSLIQEALDAVSPLPTGGSVGQVLTKTANGSTWSDAGTPTQEQVAEAVSDWADENISVETGVVIDTSLSVAGAAADAKKTGDEISDLKSQIESATGTGLDVEAQDLLIEILTNALYSTNQSANILALESNLSGGKVKYSITYNLVNTDSSNMKKRILEQSEYNTTLSAQGGYSLLSATVTMGGVDITSTAYSNGVVNIPSVTGNISISAASEAQMEILESITLANGSYIDTEYVPASLSDQIIMGVMLAENPGQYLPFAGVTRRPSSTTATELYTEYIWTTGGNTARIRAGVGAYKNPSIVYVELRTVNGNYTPHDEITSTPFYFSIKNGEQKLRANMELTESLVTNSFNTVNASTAFTSTAEMPIDSIYLGAVHDAGSHATENQYTDGVTFFGFRVFDANGNMVVDMEPAINGSHVGMYDLIRGKLYKATNGTVGTDITYTEVSAE